MPVWQWTKSPIKKYTLRGLVYGALQLFYALCKQGLFGDLNCKPHTRMMDNEAVHACETFVVKFRVTELLSETLQDHARRFLNVKSDGLHLIILCKMRFHELVYSA